MTLFKLFHSGVIHFKSFCYRLFWGSSFGALGKGTVIVSPRIFNPRDIYIGEKCLLSHFVWLATLSKGNKDNAKLQIGNRVRVGRFSEIFAVQSVVIEDGVIMAENTYISDNTHSYGDIEEYICDQPIEHIGDVVIGNGSWIGRNACIIGCKIGKNCVIGAYSLVNKDIPDNCVVVGNPARIIKRYNPQTKHWEKTDKNGKFLNEQ